jgi:hypothetical protein
MMHDQLVKRTRQIEQKFFQQDLSGGRSPLTVQATEVHLQVLLQIPTKQLQNIML